MNSPILALSSVEYGALAVAGILLFMVISLMDKLKEHDRLLKKLQSTLDSYIRDNSDHGSKIDSVQSSIAKLGGEFEEMRMEIEDAANSGNKQ